MKNLKAKLNKKSGFTLVEMLIVVAIIAILIAISIPMVTGALNKAKQATDNANVRAACAEAAIQYLTNDAKAVTAMVYDASEGKLESEVSAVEKPYAKMTTHADQYIWVKVSDDGVVSWAWGAAAPTEESGWSKGTPTDLT